MSAMSKTGSIITGELLTGFTDILYLTDEPNVAPKIKRLLKQRKLSYLILPIDKVPEIMCRLDLIGTVIVDIMGLDVSKPQKLAQIIESFEQQNIGVILLNGQTELPIKSFSLIPNENSFSTSLQAAPGFIDNLWIRISVNLAYRKRSPGIIVKPATPPKKSLTVCSNRLSDQLNATETLMENLSEQLRLAGLVQRDFLPNQLPNTDNVRWATNFIPAEWVSGDIYDIARLDEKHIGFYVADAVGHSMPAALLTIFLKQALVMRETVGSEYRIFSPAEVMRNLNVRMTGQKLSGYQFATCCYCLLNVKTLELTYARAGHPYPILIRAQEEPRQLEIRGSLLGIFEQAMYTQQTVQLQPGDKLILYSDGADPFIGSFRDNKGFVFNEGFLQIADLPIIDMFGRLNTLSQEKEISPPEIDDITLVGLELL